MADSNPRGNTGGSKMITTVFKLADCLIVAMVVVPWIGFACLFGPFLWGGTPKSDWLDDTTLLVMAAITYCAGLFLVLCRWLIWPFIKSYAARIEDRQPQQPPPRKAAPAYAWTCHVCAAANFAGEGTCLACASAADISVSEAMTAKRRLAGDSADA